MSASSGVGSTVTRACAPERERQTDGRHRGGDRRAGEQHVRLQRRDVVRDALFERGVALVRWRGGVA
jgi:hypothetical protein